MDGAGGKVGGDGGAGASGDGGAGASGDGGGCMAFPTNDASSPAPATASRNPSAFAAIPIDTRAPY